MKELLQIQAELKAPKNQFNSFGKYKYRSCEDILEAAKQLLQKYGCTLTLSDYIQTAGSLIYVEAVATITNGTDTIQVKAQAGIDVNRKGMDIAQSFGSSSSYARKYCLQGLFLLDDNSSGDPDATNTHGKDAPTRSEKLDLIRQTEKLPEERRAKAVIAINKAETQEEFIKLKTALEQIKP